MRLEPYYLELGSIQGGSVVPRATRTPVLLPHEVLAALWDAGEDQFHRAMLGGLSELGLQSF